MNDIIYLLISQSTVVAVKKLRKTHVHLSRTILMELKEVIHFSLQMPA